MELKEGMYVRTKFGHIAKISHLPDDLYLKIILDKNYLDEDGELNCGICEEDIKGKPSYNIIDLIEEHDILLLFDKEYGENYKAEVVLDGSNFKVVVNYEQCDLLNLEY